MVRVEGTFIIIEIEHTTIESVSSSISSSYFLSSVTYETEIISPNNKNRANKQL